MEINLINHFLIEKYLLYNDYYKVPCTLCNINVYNNNELQIVLPKKLSSKYYKTNLENALNELSKYNNLDKDHLIQNIQEGYKMRKKYMLADVQLRVKDKRNDFKLPTDKKLNSLEVGKKIRVCLVVGRYVPLEKIWCKIIYIEGKTKLSIIKAEILEKPMLASGEIGDIIELKRRNILDIE